MRRFWPIIPGFIVLVALALLAFPTGTAQADNGPHRAGWGAVADGCAACHRVHRGVDEFLLSDEQETLCIACHGNGALGSDLNVQGGTDEGDGGALRSGGFDTARINTADPSLRISAVGTAESGAQCRNGIDDDLDGVVDDGCPVTIGALSAAAAETVQSMHSTDGSAQVMWGNGPISAVANPGQAGYNLTCASCHDPHGNGNYRILKDEPDGSGGAGHAIPDTYPLTYTTSNYFDMTFTGSVSTDQILVDTSAWCAQCHTRYLAARRATTPADASREDSGDALFKFRHTSAGWGNSSSGTASNNNRACITCHASHGSNATAGAYSGSVPLPNGVAGSGSSDSRLLKMDNRGICQKCHNK